MVIKSIGSFELLEPEANAPTKVTFVISRDGCTLRRSHSCIIRSERWWHRRRFNYVSDGRQAPRRASRVYVQVRTISATTNDSVRCEHENPPGSCRYVTPKRWCGLSETRSKCACATTRRKRVRGWLGGETEKNKDPPLRERTSLSGQAQESQPDTVVGPQGCALPPTLFVLRSLLMRARPWLASRTKLTLINSVSTTTILLHDPHRGYGPASFVPLLPLVSSTITTPPPRRRGTSSFSSSSTSSSPAAKGERILSSSRDFIDRRRDKKARAGRLVWGCGRVADRRAVISPRRQM